MSTLQVIAQIDLNTDVEAAVRVYFADTPVMIDIARCESKFRQYNDAGNTLYGGIGGSMVGVYRIHEDVHADFAKSIGMDIYTLDGNLAYAKYLYEREGTQPWISSFPCWAPVREASPSNPGTAQVATGHSGTGSDISDVAGVITINLSLGMEHPQVLLLQKTLNAKGCTITTDGPGSPGTETLRSPIEPEMIAILEKLSLPHEKIQVRKLAGSLVAATALFTGSTLVTRNVRDFKRISELSIKAI